MKQALKGKWLVPVATLVLTLSIGGAAFAATDQSSTDTSTQATAATSTVSSADGSTSGTPSDQQQPFAKQRSEETPLTGDDLSKATAAALAKVGSDATVIRAETDADGHGAYEVHLKKADGTYATVYLDASFNVSSVEDGAMGGGKGGRDGARNGETALTGDILTQVQTAALAAAGDGSTLINASTETDNSDTTAKYEAHVKKADGTYVEIILDADFKVLSTETCQMGDGQGRRGHGPMDQAATGTSGTTSTTSGSAAGTSTGSGATSTDSSAGTTI